jgi:hypothetical protein
MFAITWASAAAVAVALSGASPPAGTPVHKRAPVKLKSVERSVYTMTQGGHNVGREAIERSTFDDNRVVFHVESEFDPAPGVTMAQKSDLTLEEESYFPLSLRVAKTVSQGKETFDHTMSVDMFANVAVIETELRGVKETRRVVVPAGTPIQEIGAVFYWYQELFWYDRKAGQHQRFQWLDPSAGTVASGELYVDGADTLTVMGKKTPVTVFKADRDKIGPATLYVDANNRIVKCEQNMVDFLLVEQSQ